MASYHNSFNLNEPINWDTSFEPSSKGSMIIWEVTQQDMEEIACSSAIQNGHVASERCTVEHFNPLPFETFEGKINLIVAQNKFRTLKKFLEFCNVSMNKNFCSQHLNWLEKQNIGAYKKRLSWTRMQTSIIWNHFREIFYEHIFSKSIKDDKMREFTNLVARFDEHAAPCGEICWALSFFILLNLRNA